MDSRAKLALSARSLGTPALAALLLAVAVCAGERAARSDAVRGRLPVPGIGTFHRQLDVELTKLDDFVRHEGPLDCLVVGSSVVYRGVDPTVVSDVYRRHTGRDVRCFSFGVLGMDEGTGGRLSSILVRRYRPELLVYAATVFGVDEKEREEIARTVEDTPWFRYQAGELTPTGWLTEHSEAYRLFLPHRNWMRPTYWMQLAYGHVLDETTVANGYGPARDARQGRYGIPPRAPDCPRAWRYPVSTAHVDGLARLGELAREGQRVAILQMPVPPQVFASCPARKREFREAAHAIARVAAASGLELWRPRPAALVPKLGWSDAFHMNPRGAEIWSRWVGARMATADVPVLAGRSR